MADDDIRMMLPDPPPPSPARREAAITGAVARFDGTSETPSVKAMRPARAAGWWTIVRRPYAGPLVAAALVATITLPFAWTAYDPRGPIAQEEAAPGARDAAPITRVTADASAPPPAIVPRPVTQGVTNASAPFARAENAAPAAKHMEMAQAETSAPAPPPPAPAVPSMKASEAAPIVVQGRAARREIQDTALAISAVSADELSANDSGSIVVTGARRSPDKAARRGDWNACTVNDPEQALTKCRKMANRGDKDIRQRADVLLADGLKRAWDGDLAEAIAAFDKAIAIAPKLSVAYLNRGLAYAQQGDDTQAIADLDRAVRYAPRSARAYYNRSVLLRNIGNIKRAETDEQRAIDLDARYEDLLR